MSTSPAGSTCILIYLKSLMMYSSLLWASYSRFIQIQYWRLYFMVRVEEMGTMKMQCWIFIVVVESYENAYQKFLPKLLNKILPPNVYFLQVGLADKKLSSEVCHRESVRSSKINV